MFLQVFDDTLQNLKFPLVFLHQLLFHLSQLDHKRPDDRLRQAQEDVIKNLTGEHGAVRGLHGETGTEGQQCVDVRVSARARLRLNIRHCHSFLGRKQRLNVEFYVRLTDRHQTERLKLP